MLEDEAGANVDPKTEPQTADDTAAEVERLRSQLKGEQRTNERLRGEIKSRLSQESVGEAVSNQGKLLEAMADTLEKLGLNDPEIGSKLQAVKAEVAQAESRRREQDNALGKIADVFADTGVDFESVEAAQAYFESGNYKKAIEVYERVAKGKKVDSAADSDEQREKIEAAKKVDAKGSSLAQATTPEGKLQAKLAEASKLSARDRVAARWAALGEHIKDK